MREVFTIKLLKHNSRSCAVLPNPKTNKYVTDTIAYKAAQLWSTQPTTYKNLQLLDLFESEIKNDIIVTACYYWYEY